MIFFIDGRAFNICLSVDYSQDCKHDRQDKENGRVDILEKLVLVVWERSTCDEVTEYGLAPVIVDEAEVPLDDSEAELLQGQYDAEE